MSLILNFVYCFTGFIGIIGGLILHVHVCQYVFQNHAKSRKIYVKATRYNYTHDQLNTNYIHFNIILKNIFEGGGEKFNFAPGRQLPSLRHCVKFLLALTIDHSQYISCTAWTYNDRYEVVPRLPACILCIASPLYVYIDFVK